ncbi:MAG: hypothetical protein K2K86_06170 [Muribaculaceae bacterium]|nr:hypothetical protein [Muribaculaceae bacterium]
MKKLLFFLACILLTVSASAAVSTVYVNPMQNGANANAVIAKRLYKKALLGLTKAKTISVSSGSKNMTPGSAEANNYDYIMTINLAKAAVEEAGTIGNLLGALGSSSAKKEPDWSGKLTTEIVIVDAKTGGEVFKTELIPSSTNKDKSLALFNATNNFDYDVTDMTDDAFRVSGEVIDAFDTDKKNIVKKVRAGIGLKDGARKNQAFELYKVVGDNSELIGSAKCVQVLNDGESILSINGKKDADKVVSDLIQNLDGSYKIVAWSRSRSGFLHNNFQGIDKMFTNEGRAPYLDPFGRTAKPRVAFLAVEINDNNFSSQRENFEKLVVKGMENVPTINLEKAIYHSIDDARKAGLDGLIEISIDKVFNTTEKTKEGKTKYDTKILYTVAGYDVAQNKWIDMKTFEGLGSSTESTAKANADALGLMDNRVQKYSEDLFPVAASIIDSKEVKKNVVKKALINVGTAMGVKKGMKFDIYEQRAEGGADSRFLLGEGKVEKEGLTANEAIIKVKGKDNGDEKLLDLLQNADENTKIVLISKASYDFLDKGLNFLNRDN